MKNCEEIVSDPNQMKICEETVSDQMGVEKVYRISSNIRN